MTTKEDRGFYAGPPEKQQQDCGRSPPQPLCMCVLCEIAVRFASIEDKERELARIKKLRADLGEPRAPHGLMRKGHPDD